MGLHGLPGSVWGGAICRVEVLREVPCIAVPAGGLARNWRLRHAVHGHLYSQ